MPGKVLIVANYAGGSTYAIALRPDGTFGTQRSLIQHEGSSVNPQRQEAPHAHCVALEPGRAEAHGGLGRAYALAGRAADAVPHLKQALTADTDGSLRYQLARCYQAIGQTEKAELALKDYEEFLKATQPGPGANAQHATITPP